MRPDSPNVIALAVRLLSRGGIEPERCCVACQELSAPAPTPCDSCDVAAALRDRYGFAEPGMAPDGSALN